MLYGITHDLKGQPVIRLPKVYKASIGLSKGPNVHVFINRAREWVIQWVPQGTKEEVHERFKIEGDGAETLMKVRKRFAECYAKAAQRPYPSKLPYFTFTRLHPSNSYIPAWDAIEAHGPQPTEIDVLFTDDKPFSAAYQWWGIGKLKCSGNGLQAARSIEFPQGQEERARAEEARKQGLKTFETTTCYTNGCPLAGKECKPHGRLQMQLVWKPQLGGVTQLDTTSIRSITNLFSCLDAFYRFTGGGDPERGYVAGIPLKLVVSPFKVVVPGSGKSSTAYQLHLEFRAETVGALKHKLMEAARSWRSAMALPPAESETKQLSAPMPSLPAPGVSGMEGLDAHIMSAEFDDDSGGGEAATDAVVTKANDRIEELAGQLSNFKAGDVETPTDDPEDAIVAGGEEEGEYDLFPDEIAEAEGVDAQYAEGEQAKPRTRRKRQ